MAILAALVLPGPRHKPHEGRRKLSQIDMATLASALDHHRLKYAGYPTGDVSAIFEALTGNNPDKIVFLDRSFRSINEKREPIDLWFTPYRIETNQTSGLSIRSAGPNRRFGDADDLSQSL